MEKIIDRFIANENMEEAASKSKDFYIFAGGILRRPQNRRTMKQWEVASETEIFPISTLDISSYFLIPSSPCFPILSLSLRRRLSFPLVWLYM